MTSTPAPGIKLLIVTADARLLAQVEQELREERVAITAVLASAAMQAFMLERPRTVVIDLATTADSELLHNVLNVDPAVEVILANGRASIDNAVEAIQQGACDYLPKPLDVKKLQSRIAGLIAEAEDRKKTLELDQELMDAYQFQGIIGRSPLMLELFAKLRRVGPHFQTVLVTGETGTGKELVARALHNLSPADSQPFVVSNCSAIVQTLLESELFGHVRGAFTGATHDKIGVFEHADGGTVFLDEIGELSLEAQAKLLRVIQNHEVQRVGSPVPRQVDVRIVAATNRDLRQMASEGRFREDLYYRIAMVELRLPRLADRKEDLPLLQRHFVSSFAKEYKKEVTGITRRAQICLSRHQWPGNVRELQNAIGTACMMTQSRVIDVLDLPEHVRNGRAPQPQQVGLISFEELQNKHLLYVLGEVGGNKARAAEILGVSRTTLYEMLSKIHSRKPIQLASRKAEVSS
ncbi:MAG TPA: sigma-54 dependent transcriptional regulator [Terriglobales bacterium]|nr:sigma-54 dependent transcriptional regulator [Terriglobales bacterium]